METETRRTIAEVVGDDRNLNERLCIDSCDRIWEIKTRHSGCILKDGQ